MNRPILDRIRNQIRFFNKSFLNKLLGKLAGAPRGPFAMVLHRGRKSGTPYQTPIIVAPVADGFVIALTYGPAVDWYRNILSAGKCKLRWHSREIDISRVAPISPQDAKPALPVFEKFMLSILGVHDFAKMWRAV